MGDRYLRLLFIDQDFVVWYDTLFCSFTDVDLRLEGLVTKACDLVRQFRRIVFQIEIYIGLKYFQESTLDCRIKEQGQYF